MKTYSAEWWAQEITSAEKELNDKWRDSGDKIVKRFLDDREDDDTISGARKYNIFWANTQILKSALYATPPKPAVKRQHDDAKDDIARTASLILQRILGFGLEAQNSDMHSAFQQATEDRLVPGMGQVWLRYDVETEPVSMPEVKTEDGTVLSPAFQGERIVKQTVFTDYIHWRDFIWSPARTWEEVTWVARRSWMTKKTFAKRFGKDKVEDLLESIKEGGNDHGYPKGFQKGKIEVFEVWCEPTNTVYFIHCGTKTELDQKEDPLKLENFWPCPKPIFATHTTNSLIPRPDYSMCQDQYDELDVLNDRINTLTRALRVVGAYDAENTALAKLLTGPELSMIPVEKWAVLAEAGGIKGVVDWFPVEQIAGVLKMLVEQRQLMVQQIYELTGISDIMRGGSNPRETLGAQKLKAQYSSVRLRLVQQDIAQFVCEALRIKSEIIAKHFDPAQIKLQSQIQWTESAMMADPAIALLKDYQSSQYRVEISEESLSMADYTAEREMRVAYLTSVGQFLSQAGQMVAGMPSALPYLVKMIQWVTASFRGADDIETVLDEAAKEAQKSPPKPEGEDVKPDHSLEIAQVNAQRDVAVQKMKSESEERMKQFELQMNLRIKEMEIRLSQQQAALAAQPEEKEPEMDFSQLAQPILEAAQTMLESAKLQSEATAQTNEAIMELASVMAKPRRRIPKRDANGDIEYSDETIIQ